MAQGGMNKDKERKKKKKKKKNEGDNDLLIAMDHVARMQVLCGSKQLVEDVLLVHLLQDVAPLDDIMQIRVWFKKQTNARNDTLG